MPEIDFSEEDEVLADVAKALEVEPDDLTIGDSPLESFRAGVAYQISHGRDEYVVVEDEDTAEAIAVAVVIQDLEEQPEIFNQHFIESHINVDQLRRDLHSDVQSSRYDDLSHEAQMRPEQFIKEYDLEWPEPTEQQIRAYAEGEFDEPEEIEAKIAEIKEMGDAEDRWIELGEEPEVPDSEVERIASEEAEAMLKDPVDYLQDIYGREDGIKQAIQIAGIDIDAAADEVVRTDGWQHFLARYDGNSHETPGGLVYWRDN